MACGPLYIFPWGLWHSITLGRLGQELLSLWKQLSSETFVSIVLLCPENMILSFAQFMSNYLVDPYRMLPDICHVRYYGKKAQNLSFTGSFCLFFFKSLCFQQIHRSKKCSYKFQSNCQKTIWTLTNCFVILFLLGNTEKSVKQLFSLERLPFLLKILCFQQPLKFLKNALIYYTAKVRKACGAWINVPLVLSCSRIREELVNWFFSIGNIAFFFENLCFQQFLRPKKMLL